MFPAYKYGEDNDPVLFFFFFFCFSFLNNIATFKINNNVKNNNNNKEPSIQNIFKLFDCFLFLITSVPSVQLRQ